MTQEEIDDLCRSIYSETRDFEPIAKLCALKEVQFGFEILMGPPFKNARLLFIGYQPGVGTLGTIKAREMGYEHDWAPQHHSICQYATERWRLAKNMQKMFSKYPETLAKSVGLNAIFVGARNIQCYEATVDKHMRVSIQDFCRERVKSIVEAVAPEKIVVIGFSTAELFGREVQHVENGKLLRRVPLFGRKAFVTPHLSAGVGYHDKDRAWMADYIMNNEP